jgi:outer membrane protein
MTIFTRRVLLAAVVCFSGFNVSAEELRIGVVLPDRVIKESHMTKQADAKLQQEFSKREKELLETDKAFKAAIEKFERDAPTLSESQRQSRQKQFAEQDRDLKRKGREFQEELNARRNEEMQQVFDRASKVIKQIGESEKYDLIIEATGTLYVNPKHDITDKVLKVINAAK